MRRKRETKCFRHSSNYRGWWGGPFIVEFVVDVKLIGNLGATTTIQGLENILLYAPGCLRVKWGGGVCEGWGGGWYRVCDGCRVGGGMGYNGMGGLYELYGLYTIRVRRNERNK